MAENKTKRSREEQIDDVQARMEEARQARLARAAQRSAASGSVKDHFVAFQEYWATVRKEYNRAKELETILWVHLKAIKHDTPDKFEAGIKHFGLAKVR